MSNPDRMSQSMYDLMQDYSDHLKYLEGFGVGGGYPSLKEVIDDLREMGERFKYALRELEERK